MNARVRNGEIKGNQSRNVLGSKWRRAWLSKSARKLQARAHGETDRGSASKGAPLANAWNK